MINKNKICFFLPTRKGSQRVKNKNTRPFANNGSLLENKLKQLIVTSKIDEIILSTNDEECIRIAEPFLKECSFFRIVERPEHLCLDTTNLQDLITYVPNITDANHILWGHVTTPIVGTNDYDNAIGLYLDKLKDGYDSLIGVTEFKNFLLNAQGKIINNTTSLPWPRTQDLESLYEINHTMFLAKREIYVEHKNRIGEHPYLFVMDKMKSFDIDWEEDYLIAELIYKSLYDE